MASGNLRMRQATYDLCQLLYSTLVSLASARQCVEGRLPGFRDVLQALENIWGVLAVAETFVYEENPYFEEVQPAHQYPTWLQGSPDVHLQRYQSGDT